jgi:hypothetical protein
MSTIKSKVVLFLFVTFAFFGPIAAVIALDKSRRAESIVAKQEEIAAAQRDAAQARFQYYSDITDRKNNLKEAMAEAKAQYEQLLKDQPGLVESKKTAVQQTIIKPVITQKLVTQQVSSSSSTPKSSTKTRTS